MTIVNGFDMKRLIAIDLRQKVAKKSFPQTHGVKFLCVLFLEIRIIISDCGSTLTIMFGHEKPNALPTFNKFNLVGYP
jgi:hypothetical protein